MRWAMVRVTIGASLLLADEIMAEHWRATVSDLLAGELEAAFDIYQERTKAGCGIV